MTPDLEPGAHGTHRTGPIRRIVIVGGGTAGWMSAAALARLIEHAGVSVTLVESEEIGTVGVGEATIPSIRVFNSLLGLDEDDVLRHTNGTFKLGIEFVDWYRRDSRYLHPFGTYGADLQAIRFHQLWLRLKELGEPQLGTLGEYNLCTMAAARHRFMRPQGGPDSVLASLRYAFHFDASAYARYLRDQAERKGVKRIEGRITDVRLRPEDGFIASVVLHDGRALEGDLFIDCSGFRSLLLGTALGIEFERWDHWLPCDRAIAVPCESTGPLLPFTRATADSAGWRWRIPLQHRTGHGHVYCSEFMSDDDALARLMAATDGAPRAEPRRLKFTTGCRHRLWEKNCVAIGLSAGFLEPLESTGIHLIQTGIATLMALFPDRRFARCENDAYNRYLRQEYAHTRDFLILHYKATERDDAPFWRRCRQMSIPDSLQQRIELFESKGRALPASDELFTLSSWVAVMMGQGIEPGGHDPLADALPLENLRQFLRHVREVVAKTAEAMPGHQAFIARTCAAPAPAASAATTP